MPTSLFTLLAALALLLPSGQAVLPSDEPPAPDEIWALGTTERPQLDEPEVAPAFSILMDSLDPDPVWQVRIEQRLIIRIAPRVPGHQMFADIPSQSSPRFYERRAGRCLAVQGIAGVQVTDDRLVLHMRDRRTMSARLEKSCHTRDFYSGFYVEQTSDGQICAGRDEVHSRAGVTCAISALHELIPDE